MSRQIKLEHTHAWEPLPPGSLQSKSWQRFLRGPDPELLEQLYVPALGEAVRYDRCCAYFSSSALAAAARGFGRLIERLLGMADTAPRPAVRLVVNEELTAQDVRALMETGDVSPLENALNRRFKSPKDLLVKKRLGMLAWLAKEGFLEVRVGVMRHGEGIVHGKFGIVTDESGHAIVFSGSGNESAKGLLANYEQLEVTTSWEDLERFQFYINEFNDLWQDIHQDVHTVTLPEALRLKLVKFAPSKPPIDEPSNALERQKAAMIWNFIVEAPYMPQGGAVCDATALVDLWPHQHRVVEETAEAWPDGRLLCDEVGLGKTIEAIFVLRRLMAGRGVRRALLLLPKNLLKQWQAELREKGGLVFPRLEGTNSLFWPDGSRERVSGLEDAFRQNVLLVSRETARTENNLPVLLAAEPWDLVLLDEAHAARRRQQEEGEFNSATLLLDLLRQLQLRRKARGLLLLSATPMQTHPWEPWDLLAVLGEGGAWLADFSGVRSFYQAVASLPEGPCDLKTAERAATLVATDSAFPDPPGNGTVRGDAKAVSETLSFASPTEREGLVRWLRKGSPLARRMHRNTRNTLRLYHDMGLLSDQPPQRRVFDFVFDYQDHAERKVYNSVSQYIDKRYRELEQEKPGRGFVMTIYRRRASSSPLALERSLKRRRDGLLRVETRWVSDDFLSPDDVPEALGLDDLPEGEGTGKIPASLPRDPQIARAEREEVDRVLEGLRGLHRCDTKRDHFFDVLRETTEDGRPVLIFTEYIDTLEYLRDALVAHYGKNLGCYSGDGGQVYDGEKWRLITKDVITEDLSDGKLRVLICTDAASEGLNLQAAGAVINYDLPWNPSKIEQRIGRIDRIGQKFSEIKVVNLFLKDSVDDRVYHVLRTRCGLFQHFVGAMQPVLAHARRMLMDQEKIDIDALEKEANQVEQDPLADEIYFESSAESISSIASSISLADLQAALTRLDGEFGLRARIRKGSEIIELSGAGPSKILFAPTIEALERDSSAQPLSPFEQRLRKLVERLWRSGERLPLVIGSHQRGAFRSSVAYWVGVGEITPVDSMKDLRQQIEAWDGTYPDPDHWHRAKHTALREAEKLVDTLETRALKRECRGLERQLDAARLRLMRELGRYLVCLGGNTSNLNEFYYQEMSKPSATAQRLKRCYEKLRDYPDWPPELRSELEDFREQITENQRQARLLGKELDAALQDPRWIVESYL